MKYTFKRVAITAGAEILSQIITSTVEEPKVIHRVYFEKNSDIDFRVYLERDRVLDFDSDLVSANENWVDLDIEMPVGESIRVGGFNNGATDVTVAIGVSYEIKK